MKKLRLLSALLALTLAVCLPAAAQAQQELSLPEDSAVFSPELAAQTLTLVGGDASSVSQALSAYGLTVVCEANYDKSPEDPSHTCAYTVAQGAISYQGEDRTLLVVAVRGTVAGEWYSNFNFAPSHRDETQFAESFLMAAQDVYLGLQPLFARVENPLVLVTGHSRGAACANLLSLFLNAAFGPQNVFVYTSATPTTVRGDMAKTDSPNVFNLINPADLVPLMPLPGWGYTRLGQDIVLPGDPALSEELRQTADALCTLSPTISSYYETRHSLTGPGESEDGLTVYELMLRVADSLIGLSAGAAEPAGTLPPIADTSDLASLAQKLASASEEDGERSRLIFHQHMPDLYARLLAAGAF